MINYDKLNDAIEGLEEAAQSLKKVGELEKLLDKTSSEVNVIIKETRGNNENINSQIREIRNDLLAQITDVNNKVVKTSREIKNDLSAQITDLNNKVVKTSSVIAEIDLKITEMIKDTKRNKKHIIGVILGGCVAILIAVIVGFFI